MALSSLLFLTKVNSSSFQLNVKIEDLNKPIKSFHGNYYYYSDRIV
jgi:hypothetical protein